MSSKQIKIDNFKIILPDWWEDISQSNPNGPQTFIDGRLNEPGVLQISIAKYVAGEKPEASYQDLVQLSENAGRDNTFGKVTNRSSGNCKVGKYGVVEFSGDKFPYISVWHLSNGRDFIFSTFICSKIPETSELNEVKQMLITMKKKQSLF